jgi:crotonobetainyl-CoA:carnitine CoA-transferase CaiB-like acyl-CoA transferase
MTMLQGLSVSARLMMGFAIPRMPRKYQANPLWNHYRCKDDRWICLGMLQPDRYWADFCRALGRPELGTDERFAELRARASNCGAAIEILDEIFATRPRAEWMEILRTSGDFIFCQVNSVDELPDDPQVKANDYVVDFDHPRYGATKVVGMPVRLGKTPGSIRTAAPEFGQHTEEILVDLLGYSWDEVAKLRDEEVI